jgi:hypothetical protein
MLTVRAEKQDFDSKIHLPKPFRQHQPSCHKESGPDGRTHPLSQRQATSTGSSSTPNSDPQLIKERIHDSTSFRAPHL